MKLPLHHIFRVTLLFICFSLAGACARCQDTTVHVFQPPADTFTTDHQEDVPHFDKVKAILFIHGHHVPDTVISHLKKQEDYWYADSTPGKINGRGSNSSGGKKSNDGERSIWNQ